jgi:hypothetical protein
MAKTKHAPTLTPAGVLDWTGVRTHRVVSNNLIDGSNQV